MIITCKTCNTRFKLDESILTGTASKVRCSACKNVFNVFPTTVPFREGDTLPETDEAKQTAEDLETDAILDIGKMFEMEETPWEAVFEDKGEEKFGLSVLAESLEAEETPDEAERDIRKTRVAFFDFADCEGCQLQVTYLNEQLLEVLEYFEIVNFREAISERSDDYDIAIVEGSITRQHDEDRLISIRERANILIAYGACACIGGVNGLRLKLSSKEARDIVYNGRKDNLEVGRPRPVSEVVEVDYYIHGCPTNNKEFITVLKSILIGKDYFPPNYAVCVECKFKENVCLFEKGEVCMGPFTRAGCGAWCISYGNTCYGCRGLLSRTVDNAQRNILEKNGYKVKDVEQKFETYNLCKMTGG